MKWQIKKFNELSVEELYKIIQLRDKIFVVEQECIYLECDGNDIDAYHLIGTDNDKVIATLRILDKEVEYKEISIGRVAVDIDYRSQHLGEKSIELALEFIENTYGKTPIRIAALAYAKDFYKNFGFEEVSGVYLEDNLRHIEMLRK